MYREWNTFAKNFQSAHIESKPPKGIQPPSLSFMSAYKHINSVTYIYIRCTKSSIALQHRLPFGKGEKMSPENYPILNGKMYL